MSAKRAYSDEGQRSPDRYSDDFVSDDDKATPKQKKGPIPRTNLSHHYYQDKFRGRGSGSIQGHSRLLRNERGNGRGNSGASESADVKKSNDNITTRVLSASRNRINELRNKVEELQMKIRNLEQENKLYKTMQFRHEKTIRTFEHNENDLPMILDKHNNEVRVLKDQNRRLREKYEKSDRYLRDAEDELLKVKIKMNKYKEICEDKELMERDELSHKLVKAEKEMEEKEIKIKELQKHIEVLKKSHKHEIGIDAARHKDVRKELEELKEKFSQLGYQLKEKERALDYQNIHSHTRQWRSSRNTSPDGSLTKKSKRKTASMTELTPRNKAKFYSEKQRAELHKQKELKKEQERNKNKKLEDENEKHSLPKSPPDLLFSSFNSTLDDKEEISKWQTEESPNIAIDIVEQERQRLHSQQNEPHKLREQNVHRLVKEDNDRKDKEEMEKRKQEKEQGGQTREDHENKVKIKKIEMQNDDIQGRKKAEEEKRQHLQKEKLESDSVLQAERKKKDELLKKLKAMDEKGSTAITTATQPSLVNKGKDHPSVFGEFNENTSSTSVSNLHHTKEPQDDITSPYLERQKSKQQPSSNDTEGYKPSFGPVRGSTNKPSNNKPASVFDDDDDEPAFKITNNISSNAMTRQEDKKPNLLEALFGPQANSKENQGTKNVENKETFFISNNSPSLNGQTAAVTNTPFPWEATSGLTKSNKPILDSNKKSTVIGRGSSMINNSIFDSGNNVRLNQQKQQSNTFPAKSSVTAVDSFSDEIEEFVL